MPDELETRYYIALMSSGVKVTAKLGPARPDQFNTGPTELFTDDNNVAYYPVSRSIAEEWTDDEDDDA